MGSLALATAIGGVGKGMQANVEHSRVMEREDLDRDHDLQLEKQRAASNLSLQESGQEFATQTADIRFGREQELAETAFGRQEGLATTRREHEIDLTELETQSRETIALIGAYQSRTSTTGTKWKGWTVKTDTVDEMNMETSQMTQRPVYTATRQGSPGAWVQKAGMMILGGDEANLRVEQDPAKRRAIEDDLVANAGDKEIEQDFIDKYGYLPIRYMETISMSGDVGLREFVESNRSREPAYDMQPRRGEGPDQTKGRSIFEQGAAAGGAPMSPSIEELSEGPARDANIAEKGGTNAELAAGMRREAGGRLTQGGNLQQPEILTLAEQRERQNVERRTFKK